MSVISFTDFVGMNTDISSPLLPQSFAAEAINVFTDQGALSTWKGLNPVTGTWNTKTGDIRSLFLMDNSLWLAWGETVNACLMQKEANTDWEIVFTGTDQPRYTDKLKAIQGGGTAYPEVSFPLGIPAPDKVLKAASQANTISANAMKASWSIAGTVDDEIGDRIARSYVYTYVSDTGREGPPSEASNTVYNNDDESIVLTQYDGGTISAPRSDITKIRVYATATGGTFNYHSEHTLPLTSITISDFNFGSAITTTLYSPPPDDLTGIVAMANGMLAGYVGNNLYFSEPYQSHAWPEDYIKPMDYPIKGLSAIGNMLFISTEGYPVIAVGNSPDYMTFTKLGAIQSNVALRSMVDMGNGAMYASRDGIVLLTNGNAEMITDGIISERVYQLLNPTSFHAYFYRDKYICFYDATNAYVEYGYWVTGYCEGDETAVPGYVMESTTHEFYPAKGAFILDPKRRTVTFTDVTCSTAFSDKVSGKLYLVKNEEGVNNLYEWNEGSSNLAQAWRTKPIQTPPTCFSVARVWADRYPVTFELFADENRKYIKTVNNDSPFRLPGGYKGRLWQTRLSGDSYVNGVFLANAMSELK